MTERQYAPSIGGDDQTGGGTAVSDSRKLRVNRLGRLLARWSRMRLSLFLTRTQPDEYAGPLLDAFEGGLTLVVQADREWRAFAEHMDLERRQVVLRLRLKERVRHAYEQQQQWQQMVQQEAQERRQRLGRQISTERPDPSASLPREEVADASGSEDLVLHYSFLITLTVDENLRLFREYARNELRRLRGVEPQERDTGAYAAGNSLHTYGRMGQ